MKYPGYESGKVVLSEGKWYSFRIHNHLQLQDGLWYFVIEDINGLKHFMPAEFYKGYNLNKGNEIMCRVDKINCTGRIFLEPEHPYYTEGEIYNFEVESVSDKDDSNVLLVKDILGNSIEVQQYDFFGSKFETKKRVQCIVRSIKKGMPTLEICGTCP